MPLLVEYNETKTIRTEIGAVLDGSDPFGHKIIKSTENLGAIELTGEDGTLKKGVWSDSDGTLYAKISTRVTTLEQVQTSKLEQLKGSAESEAKTLSQLDPQRAEKIEAIVAKLAEKSAEVNGATTIQECEAV